ncbi:hypothetical protein LPJ71_010448, partial [Coemansia sp. S17]
LLVLSLLKKEQTRGGHSSSVPRVRPAAVDISNGKISLTRQGDRLLDSSNRTSHQLPPRLRLRQMVVDMRSPKLSPSVNAGYLLLSERRPSRQVTRAESITYVLVRSWHAGLSAGRTMSRSICLGHRAVSRLCRHLLRLLVSSVGSLVTGLEIALTRRVLLLLLIRPRDMLLAGLPGVLEVRVKLERHAAAEGEDVDAVARGLIDLVIQLTSLVGKIGIQTLH